jgi:hypothetical protein
MKIYQLALRRKPPGVRTHQAAITGRLAPFR